MCVCARACVRVCVWLGRRCAWCFFARTVPLVCAAFLPPCRALDEMIGPCDWRRETTLVVYGVTSLEGLDGPGRTFCYTFVPNQFMGTRFMGSRFGWFLAISNYLELSRIISNYLEDVGQVESNLHVWDLFLHFLSFV